MTREDASPGFARESSRIGLNLAALVASRFLCLGLTLVQAGIIFRALPVAGWGQFGFALNYPALFAVFATLGIQRLLVRDIARNPAIAWTHVGTATAVTAVLSAAVTAVVMASVFVIEPDPMVRAAVFMASLSVIVLYALQRPFEALLMARERMVTIAVVNVAAGAVRLACTAYALSRTPTSAAAHGAIAVGNAIGFVLCVAAAAALTGWARPRVRLRLAWEQISGSLPFTVAGVFSMVYFKSDMSILKWLAGESAAGEYTASQRIMEPLLMIAAIWGTAVFPALCRFSVNAPRRYDLLMKTSARLALLVAFPVAFGVGFLGGPILALLTGASPETLREAVFVLRLLCVVTPFFYLNSVGQEFLYATDRNWFVPAAYGLASVVSVACNILLIPRFGVAAVAYTAILTNALISVLFVWAMQSAYGAMGLAGLLTKTAVACIAMGLAAQAVAPASLLAAIVAGAAVYAALQYTFRTLTPLERGLVLGLLRAPFARLTPQPPANGDQA